MIQALQPYDFRVNDLSKLCELSFFKDVQGRIALQLYVVIKIDLHIICAKSKVKITLGRMSIHYIVRVGTQNYFV